MRALGKRPRSGERGYGKVARNFGHTRVPARRAIRSFKCKTSQGVTFKVTAEGLASITVGDKEVAKGS
jgi:hypothetical protein